MRVDDRVRHRAELWRGTIRSVQRCPRLRQLCELVTVGCDDGRVWAGRSDDLDVIEPTFTRQPEPAIDTRNLRRLDVLPLAGGRKVGPFVIYQGGRA